MEMPSSTGSRLLRAAVVAMVAIGGVAGFSNLSAAAAATSITIGPSADTYVDSSAPNQNFGTSTELETDGTPRRRAYLKFSVPTNSAAVTGATLRVYATSSDATGYELYRVASTSWGETSLTYQNRPFMGTKISASGPVDTDSWTEVDVSAYVKSPGTYTMAMVSRAAKKITYASRQSAGHDPQLVVEYGGLPTPPPVDTSSAPTVTSAPAVSSAPPATSAPAPSAVPPPSSSVPTSTPSPGSSKVLVIVDENHTQAQAQAAMPYLVSLQNTFGVTTHHTAATHPSLPNYLVLAGGSTFGVTDNSAPSINGIAGAQSVFGAAIAAGLTAKTYNESMTSNCQLTTDGVYAVKHNPWTYFTDERADCKQFDVPLTSLPADITSGSLPNVGMVTPNLCNDGHDCSLGTADGFLQDWVPQLMNGPDYEAGNLTIVITFDEGIGSNQTVQTVVINPEVQSLEVTTPLTHAGLSRWLYRVSDSTPQKGAATATDFGAAFGL